MRQYKQTLWLGASFVVFISFQNCSQVEFADSAALKAAKADPGVSVGLVGEDGAPANEIADSAGQTGIPTGDLPPMPTNTDTADNNEPVPTTSEVLPNTDLPSDESLFAACAPEKQYMQLVELADGANVADERGNLAFMAQESLGDLSRLFGNLHVYGKGGSRTIESISESNGNLVICGLSVKSVANFTRGNLVVIGGNVGDIEGFHGNLRVIGGAILGSVTNSKGKIVATP